ncbi:MAG: RNA polymerase sporulation sigma factor SigE, partial [Clostridia bacterium]|nr:RNA polymerase sporulation sigma factor SigE [Clostridia bacterium]
MLSYLDIPDKAEMAKTKLIEHNLRLVVYIAKRFENTKVGLEDLVSIGTVGLMKAIN